MPHGLSGKLFGRSEGEPGFFIGGTGLGTRLFLFIPSSDVSKVYGYTYSNYSGFGTVYGKGHWQQSAFSTSKFNFHIWNGRQDDTGFPKFSYVDPNSSISNPNHSTSFPLNLAYSNGRFMAVSYINSSTPTVGDVFTSTDGWNWTVYRSILPVHTYNWSGPVHNPTTNTWMIAGNSNRAIIASTSNGAGWSQRFSLSGTSLSGLAYGNGTWLVPLYDYNTNTVYTSTNDGFSWTTRSTGSIFNNCYLRAAHWNEHDQQFVIAGGYYNGTDFDARIATSPNGTTWTARETGSKKCIISNICGDDRGNYVAVGQGYPSGTFGATDVYLYSTDSGVTWTTGTLPANFNYGVGWNTRISWGDPRDRS